MFSTHKYTDQSEEIRQRSAAEQDGKTCNQGSEFGIKMSRIESETRRDAMSFVEHRYWILIINKVILVSIAFQNSGYYIPSKTPLLRFSNANDLSYFDAHSETNEFMSTAGASELIGLYDWANATKNDKIFWMVLKSQILRMKKFLIILALNWLLLIINLSRSKTRGRRLAIYRLKSFICIFTKIKVSKKSRRC